jgi:hypothetical protein
MLADKVDDRNLRSPGVVQISEAIAETGAEMQERACRLFSHARIAVSSSGDYAFEEPKHTANCRFAVQRGNDVNFRSAGVGKASVDGSGGQGAN